MCVRVLVCVCMYVCLYVCVSLRLRVCGCVSWILKNDSTRSRKSQHLAKSCSMCLLYRGANAHLEGGKLSMVLTESASGACAIRQPSHLTTLRPLCFERRDLNKVKKRSGAALWLSCVYPITPVSSSPFLFCFSNQPTARSLSPPPLMV